MPDKKIAKNIPFLFFSTILFMSFHANIFAQHEHEEEIHNEISAGGGIAISTESVGISPAIHLHAIKGLSSEIGVGLGYEAILGGELHQSIIAFFNYKPHHLIDLNVGPGIVLPSHDEGMAFVLSAECAVPLHLGEHVHLGPLIDLGWSVHGLHVIAGIHCGVDL